MYKRLAFAVEAIVGKKIRKAELYKSDPFGADKITALELVFDDETAIGFFILDDKLEHTPLCAANTILKSS